MKYSAIKACPSTNTASRTSMFVTARAPHWHRPVAAVVPVTAGERPKSDSHAA
jgi:hypothetical protein